MDEDTPGRVRWTCPRWLGYGLAVVGPVAAFAITESLPALFSRTPFALYFILGGLLTLWAGVGPGLVMTALCVVALMVVRQPPMGPLTTLGALLVAAPILVMIHRYHRALQSLRDSRRLYQHLSDLSSDLVMLDDLDGRIVAINPAGVALSGYPIDQVIGHELLGFVAPEHRDRARAARQALLAPGGPKTVSLELDIRKADGQYVTVDLRLGLAVSDGRTVGFHSVARDVTERRRLETQLRQSQKVEAIGRLAGGVAHDFNNMLTAIMGYADAALQGLGRTHRQADNLRGLLSVCERAADLVRQLLAFGRQQALQPAVVDPNEVVGGVESMLRRLIGADITLDIHLDPAVGRTCVDPSQLTQVLMNLAINARDAMPSGGTLRITTATTDVPAGSTRGGACVEPGRYVVITVTDTGQGMDATTQARIFEPFFTTKREGAGTGLGLATVYGIVKQSGGYIWVESALGRGTRFEIDLPQVDEPTAETRVEEPAADAPSGTETILLAEDDPDIRALVTETLTELGYAVLGLPDGTTAATVADDGVERIDLVLADVVMPGMSGPELVTHVRRARPEVKALYLSGFVPVEGQPRPYAIDAPLIQKPFTAKTLAREVRAVLDGPPDLGV